MDGAFARLYRSSKLASYDRSIKQIYTTTGKNAAAKDWGLKRPMPSKMKTRLASIGSLDTREQITDFTPTNREYMIMQTWKENFTESHSPHSEASKEDVFDVLGSFDGQESHFESHAGQINDQKSRANDAGAKQRGPLRSLGQMSKKQWKRFLEEAHSRRAEWKDELEKGNFVPEEALAFMGATNGSGSGGVHHQPTYHDYVPPSESLQVQGRVLGRLGSMYTVAVQGITASLPLQNHTAEAGFHLRDVKTFYVHSAKFDSRGRPVVLLGLQPRGARESVIAFKSNQGRFKFSKSADSGSTMHSEYLGIIKNTMDLGKLLGNKKHEAEDGNKAPESTDEKSRTDAIQDTLDFLHKDRK